MRGFIWSPEFTDMVDAYGQLVKEVKAPIPKSFVSPGCTKYSPAPSVKRNVNSTYVHKKVLLKK